MIQKRVLIPERLRRPPDSGWSWVDRRFVREYAEHVSREAVSLYFFLAAVGDRQGLSFYSDASIALTLRLMPEAVARAREELVEQDLIACEPPLTQVLSLRPRCLRRHAAPGQGLLQLGDLFRRIAAQPAEASDAEQPRRLP
jgi:hypothetical protein